MDRGDGLFDAIVGAEDSYLDPVALAIADFNSDSISDAAVLAYDSDVYYLNYLRGNGDGTFQSWLEVAQLTGGDDVQAADFDRDGNVDLMVFMDEAPGAYAFKGNGDSSFEPPVAYQTYYGIDPVVADIDENGSPDLVFADEMAISFLNAVCVGECSIGGLCYDDGAVNPINPCQVCDYNTYPTHWSDNGPVPCDDHRFCNGDDTCSEGVCSVHTGDPCTDDDIFCGRPRILEVALKNRERRVGTNQNLLVALHRRIRRVRGPHQGVGLFPFK